MPNILTVKIDVRKLDKARFFEGRADKNGHKPLYADIVLIPRRDVGQYGDTHLVKQSVSKQEREAKVELPIIGSATERASQSPPCPAPAQRAPAAQQNLDEDVPF